MSMANIMEPDPLLTLQEGEGNEELIRSEITNLESRLKALYARLGSPIPTSLPTQPHKQLLHPLLLFTDSALPLGTFAFSSGLESFLAHHPSSKSHTQVASSTPIARLLHFLHLSTRSLASTDLPFLTAAHATPHLIGQLDDALDASLPCPVTRRSSISQGRALLAIYHRSFSGSFPAKSAHAFRAIDALQLYAQNFKRVDLEEHPDLLPSHGHFATTWGIVSVVLGFAAEDAAWCYLFGHVRAILSAAVRLGVLGPYHAQGLLASQEARDLVNEGVRRCSDVLWEDAGQVWPVGDLWVGRHECLYSRMFNS